MVVIGGGRGRAGVRQTKGFMGLLTAHWFVHLAGYHLSCSFIMEHMPSTRPGGGGDMPTGRQLSNHPLLFSRKIFAYCAKSAIKFVKDP